MDTQKRKVAVVILLDVDKDTKEITMGEFIDLLKREREVDEKIVFPETVTVS